MLARERVRSIGAGERRPHSIARDRRQAEGGSHHAGQAIAILVETDQRPGAAAGNAGVCRADVRGATGRVIDAGSREDDALAVARQVRPARIEQGRACPDDGPGREIAHEHVAMGAGVAGIESGRMAGECDEPCIARDRHATAVSVHGAAQPTAAAEHEASHPGRLDRQHDALERVLARPRGIAEARRPGDDAAIVGGCRVTHGLVAGAGVGRAATQIHRGTRRQRPQLPLKRLLVEVHDGRTAGGERGRGQKKSVRGDAIGDPAHAGARRVVDEHVGPTVAVARNQVRRVRCERQARTVCGDARPVLILDGAPGGPVAGPAAGAGGNQRDGPRRRVRRQLQRRQVHVDRVVVGVRRDEVQARREDHAHPRAGPIDAQGRGKNPAVRHAVGRAGLDVAHIDRVIRILAGNQRRQPASQGKGDKPCVRRNRGVVRAVVERMRGLRAVRLDGDAHGLAGLQVLAENVVRVVGVAGHEVARVGHERHVAPVRADRRRPALAIGLPTEGVDRCARHRVGLTVEHEDVLDAVGIAGHEVAGERRERQEAPIGRHRGAITAVVGGKNLGAACRGRGQQQQSREPGKSRAAPAIERVHRHARSQRFRRVLWMTTAIPVDDYTADLLGHAAQIPGRCAIPRFTKERPDLSPALLRAGRRRQP